MKIRGILFDKDGTLIDFYSLWLQAAMEVIPKLLVNYGIENSKMEEVLFHALGVRDGKVDPRGALAYKSYKEIGEDAGNALEEESIFLDKEELWKEMRDLFQKSVTKKEITFQTFTDLKKLMRDLKSRGFYLGLATADTQDSAKSCMETLEILEDLDYLGADDGRLKPKPEPDMFLEFARKFSLCSGEIAVVGDTPNDIRFAKECGGISIGVLSGVGSEDDMKEADYLISSVAELPKLVDQIAGSQIR